MKASPGFEQAIQLQGSRCVERASLLQQVSQSFDGIGQLLVIAPGIAMLAYHGLMHRSLAKRRICTRPR
jgi:hypothetical protein